VSRRVDDLNADYRLTTEIRRFEIDPQPTPTAVVEFAARLLGGDGKVIDARMFKVTAPAKSMQADDALAALNAAFAQAAEQLVVWTVGAL
jgi:cholesterol transport system auxiliary component